MGSKTIGHLTYVLLICVLISSRLFLPIIQATQDQRKTYVIYMGDRIKPHIPAQQLHIDMLSHVLQNVPSHKISDHLLYSYESFHGCVAKLSEKEANIIAGMDGVVSVFPNQKKFLSTTKSWDFMDFSLNVERNNDVESNIIIGVIDSGIWPEHESFQDDGLSPPPKRWKGVCQTANDNFTCNNKIIGARYFRADGEIPEKDIASPRDTDGHGTHCASTAAGRVVKEASFLGLGLGTARGGVPSARIAVYKTCWSDGCQDADVMAAFDMAILDGVDILSVSLAGAAEQYVTDPIAIGAFHAMRKGILTSTVAGNDGPRLHSIAHFAPWLLVVGASTMDRYFTTKVLLGNGMVIQGTSTINTFDLQNKSFPLIYGGDAPDKSSNSSISRFCLLGTLDKKAVKGKIVLCDFEYGTEAFHDGAAGIVIMQNFKPEDGDIIYPLPSSIVRADHASILLSYTRNSTSTPFGSILKSVEGNDISAPLVASFSSRGPPSFSSGILKPDLVAPGVSILAAWSPIASVSGVEGDQRSVPFNMIQGTSMACPHATAVAAYVKSFHPTWSESAIRSALMTTAIPMRRALYKEAEFAYGSGHLNPLKAISPGLVYDASVGDYVKFLCSQGLNETAIRIITSESINCQQKTSSWDLNYPSIALATSLDSFDTMFTRNVTNVGSPNSTYAATVTMFERHQPFDIKVQPSVLSFNSVGQIMSFTVRVSGRIGSRALMSASLVWDDGQHKVRSPIVVFKDFKPTQ